MEGVADRRESAIGARRRVSRAVGNLRGERLVRPLAVAAVQERIEALLLLEHARVSC